VKALLAGLLLMMVANPIVAGALTLTVEVYRFAGETDFEQQSSETQLALSADKAPVVSQKLELLPGAPAQSSIQHGAFILQVNASAAPMKEASSVLHLNFSLREEVTVD